MDAYYWLNEGNDSLMTQYLQKVKEVKEKYPKPEASDANV
jgi:hypothetical protein